MEQICVLCITYQKDAREAMMDLGQEYYDMFGRPNDSENKMPFYMTYPMKNTFLEEAEYEADCRRLQEMYPKDARRIQKLVSGECDKMEYEGSMMFDEYPDRFMLRLLCRNIYRELNRGDGGELAEMKHDDTLFQMIEVMLMQEMYRRRCRYHRCRRWY